MWRILMVVVGCVPVLVLLGFIFANRWQRKRAGERPFQQDKLLRPAGYSLMLRLEELSDTFTGWILGASLCSLASVGAITATQSARAFSSITLFLLFSSAAAVCTVMAWRTGRRIREHHLGWLGEQSVAEQLQELLPHGYRVFHDIPGEHHWNIDHVVVGPAGVFAVETKSRSKRPGRQGQGVHEAVFDGKAIRFPRFTDAKTPQQAQCNAKWLARMLSDATGERVVARSLVALPGWWVTLKVVSDVKILSGKQITGFILKEAPVLAQDAIKRIAYQLDRRCRTVSF